MENGNGSKLQVGNCYLLDFSPFFLDHLQFQWRRKDFFEVGANFSDQGVETEALMWREKFLILASPNGLFWLSLDDYYCHLALQKEIKKTDVKENIILGEDGGENAPFSVPLQSPCPRL